MKLLPGSTWPRVTTYPSPDGLFNAHVIDAIDGPSFALSCYYSVVVMPAGINVSAFHGAGDLDIPGLYSRGGYEVFFPACDPGMYGHQSPSLAWLGKKQLLVAYSLPPGAQGPDSYQVKTRDRSGKITISFVFSAEWE
ncbi:hypothetical protein [Pseudomonas sp. dw_358]|uniref:hypothetical protein n=1 Tax=Pseudomonas sp. dw_358 TaxID=2720083 RepID=UPI001BD49CC9|nr:hypothetical protein [Pseudomonas sp. dw_358]